MLKLVLNLSVVIIPFLDILYMPFATFINQTLDVGVSMLIFAQESALSGYRVVLWEC